jgi:uncharacterized membrane protein YfcA
MEVLFPVSGVETYLWLPFAVALAVSFLTSMAGVSGAFLLLPFQMSALGFATPAVSPTNLVYNVVAIPSGVYRYIREGRMVWPLTWAVIAGTLPGVFVGAWVRVTYLPEPRPFKAFVGCVLLYIAARLLADIRRDGRGAGTSPPAGADRSGWKVEIRQRTWRRLAYDFRGETHSASVPFIFAVSLVVGAIGGIYGIGGGAIIAPFFVAVCGLPVHTVAGATLMGTFVTSVAGVGFYQLIAPHYADAGIAVAPDWALGALFGAGGICGMYLGARTQRFVPALWLKVLLAALLLVVAARYLSAYLL